MNLFSFFRPEHPGDRVVCDQLASSHSAIKMIQQRIDKRLADGAIAGPTAQELCGECLTIADLLLGCAETLHTTPRTSLTTDVRDRWAEIYLKVASDLRNVMATIDAGHTHDTPGGVTGSDSQRTADQREVAALAVLMVMSKTKQRQLDMLRAALRRLDTTLHVVSEAVVVLRVQRGS